MGLEAISRAVGFLALGAPVLEPVVKVDVCQVEQDFLGTDSAAQSAHVSAAVHGHGVPLQHGLVRQLADARVIIVVCKRTNVVVVHLNSMNS